MILGPRRRWHPQCAVAASRGVGVPDTPKSPAGTPVLAWTGPEAPAGPSQPAKGRVRPTGTN